ncbi:MAG: hypothetical protein MZV63_57610, partial [Marinilabiliales bacterium]|nr:hypothetical protein [Marinilabiliales bacterium]
LYFVQLRIAKVNTKDTDNFLPAPGSYFMYYVMIADGASGYPGSRATGRKPSGPSSSYFTIQLTVAVWYVFFRVQGPKYRILRSSGTTGTATSPGFFFVPFFQRGFETVTLSGGRLPLLPRPVHHPLRPLSPGAGTGGPLAFYLPMLALVLPATVCVFARRTPADGLGGPGPGPCVTPATWRYDPVRKLLGYPVRSARAGSGAAVEGPPLDGAAERDMSAGDAAGPSDVPVPFRGRADRLPAPRSADPGGGSSASAPTSPPASFCPPIPGDSPVVSPERGPHPPVEPRIPGSSSSPGEGQRLRVHAQGPPQGRAYALTLDSGTSGVQRPRHCASAPRPGQDGYRITRDMIEAYVPARIELGYASIPGGVRPGRRPNLAGADSTASAWAARSAGSPCSPGAPNASEAALIALLLGLAPGRRGLPRDRQPGPDRARTRPWGAGSIPVDPLRHALVRRALEFPGASGDPAAVSWPGFPDSRLAPSSRG